MSDIVMQEGTLGSDPIGELVGYVYVNAGFGKGSHICPMYENNILQLTGNTGRDRQL